MVLFCWWKLGVGSLVIVITAVALNRLRRGAKFEFREPCQSLPIPAINQSFFFAGI